MVRSNKYIELDARKRIALGGMARHHLYLVHVADTGVITLTPAEVTPLTTAPPVRKRPVPRKAAAAEPTKESKREY